VKVGSLIAMAIVAGSGVLGWALGRSWTPAAAKPPTIVTPVEPKPQPPRQVAPPRVAEPSALAGWGVWPEERRLQVITRMQEDAELPASVVDFLKQELRDRSHWAVTRNNIANCLVGQQVKDRGLWRVFAAMHDEAGEDPVWRDYCIQFLACCLKDADDRAAAAGKLLHVAAGGDAGIRTTAAIHVLWQSQAGNLALPADFLASQAARLAQPTTTPGERSSILGLLAESGEARWLATVRGVAAAPSSDEVLRAALAALARLGQAEDAETLQKATAHANPSVATVAKRGLEVLQKRLGKP